MVCISFSKRPPRFKVPIFKNIIKLLSLDVAYIVPHGSIFHFILQKQPTIFHLVGSSSVVSIIHFLAVVAFSQVISQAPPRTDGPDSRISCAGTLYKLHIKPRVSQNGPVGQLVIWGSRGWEYSRDKLHRSQNLRTTAP
mmetsp:Transcript_22652/g.49229  ORF Transcript_22652/g.49229 Transcript_22652/m.49229 type:complete len:139 (-) Transcript_22652:165-581(-)